MKNVFRIGVIGGDGCVVEAQYEDPLVIHIQRRGVLISQEVEPEAGDSGRRYTFHNWRRVAWYVLPGGLWPRLLDDGAA